MLTTVIALVALAFTAIFDPILNRLYFHPLSSFPGPILWRLTRIPYAISLYRGTLVHDLLALHKTYGDTVRIAPNELSFTNPQASRDIYGKHAGQPAFPKSQTWVPTPPKGSRAPSILNADDEDHARIRKAWLYGFSEKSLKAQEGIVRGYVVKLIRQLEKRVDGNGDARFVDVDVVKWYNYCAFDIVGDLTFGESFGCLDRDEYHEWVGAIIHHFKAASMMTAYKFFPWVHKFMASRVPKESMMKQAQHFQWAKQKAKTRLETVKDRPDFVAHLTKSREGLTDDEIMTTAAIIIIAGSNSLTTTLSGTTNYLLRNSEVLKELTKEIREAFDGKDHTEITIQALSQLPYLNAVIEEGLRVITPVPLGMARTVPDGGATVCGNALQAGTAVSYQSYAATHSAQNFSDPDEFRPERWMADNTTDRLDASQPFSMGPRSCLGRNMAYFELRLVLAMMVRNFDLSLPGGPGLVWTDQKTYATWIKDPFQVRLRRARGFEVQRKHPLHGIA